MTRVLVVFLYFTTSDQKVIGLDRNDFCSLLTLAVKSSYFSFDNTIYRQLDGVSMGSPLGPVFANIFLAYHENGWINNCPVEFKPAFYRRYVDDTFLLFQDPSSV